MAKRQLRLGAFMRPVSIHTGAWRYPGAWPDANFNFSHIKRLIQKLEAGKFDAFFMADHLAVLNMPINALKRSHTVTSFEPFTLLSALSAVTEHIGLIATGSTTFDEPYHVARRFASLDHISGGRAGWNIVTTSNPDAALNFGLEDHMDPAGRFRRGRRQRRGSPRKTRQARQHGALRQRHRLALGDARDRCVGLRPGRPVAADPGDQCEQERTPAPGRSRRARQAHRAPTRAT